MIINTRLENEFNLLPVEHETELEPVEDAASMESYAAMDKITSALPEVGGLETSDSEFDQLAAYAIKAHQDLMDLSMSVEEKYSGEIAGAAAAMLGHAITAKTNKIKKKLNMVELQIKKQMADARFKSKELPGNNDSNGTILDRNELLEHLRQAAQNRTQA